MNQIKASFEKTFKVFFREKSVLFWTIAWPIVWVLIDCFSFTGHIPKNFVPYAKASITIAMATFSITIAGMANLPGDIARDREIGLLEKLMSIPLSPWKDFVGRILGLVTFSCFAIILVIITGLLCGSHFVCSGLSLLKSVGFLVLILFASSGIGLTVAAFVKSVQGTTMTGVGISVIAASISGIFVPYSSLPAPLRAFARIYPVSSANSSIVYLVVGKGFAGYNPVTPAQITGTVLLSLSIFAFGIIFYSRFWGRN